VSAIRFRSFYLPHQPLVRVTFAYERTGPATARVVADFTGRPLLEGVSGEDRAAYWRGVRATLRAELEAGGGKEMRAAEPLSTDFPARTSAEWYAHRAEMIGKGTRRP
jgi:hypothetical protein